VPRLAMMKTFVATAGMRRARKGMSTTSVVNELQRDVEMPQPHPSRPGKALQGWGLDLNRQRRLAYSAPTFPP
jgi:hypothetical protein